MDQQIKTLDNANTENEMMMSSHIEVTPETDDNKNQLNEQKIKFTLDDLYTEAQSPLPPLVDNEPTNM